jgi:hypothetical protein
MNASRSNTKQPFFLQRTFAGSGDQVLGVRGKDLGLRVEG